MGHWGTGISSNDTYMEVYENFIHYYNHDAEIPEIVQQLEVDFAETIGNPDTVHDYWFALAKGLWECQALDSSTLEKVRDIIDSGANIAVWKSLEASSKDLKARQKVLEKFLLQIQVPKDKPRKRKKIHYYSGHYEKGTCLAFRMKNGNWGGALVLEQEQQTTEGYNYIAGLFLEKPEMPVPADFHEASVLTVRRQSRFETPVVHYESFRIFYIEAAYFKHNKNITEVLIPVGTLPVHKKFERYFDAVFLLYNWADIAELVEADMEKIKAGEEEKIHATVREWIDA